MVLTDRNTGGGRAWQFLCCNAAYRTAWRRRHAQPGLPKQAHFQVRLQTAADLAASLSGLRLVNGDFGLKIERGRAATQLRIPAGSGFGPADEVLAQHDILLSPATFSSHLRGACALTGWEVPRWGGRGAAPLHLTGEGPQALRCPGTKAREGSGSSKLRFEGQRRKSVCDDATSGHGIGFRVRRPA